MGVNVSRESEASLKRHRDIEKTLKEEREKSQTNLKLLLLGAGDSGKSTIVKQMRILHAGGFNEQELVHQRSMVIDNVLRAIGAIVRAMTDLGIEFANSSNIDAAKIILKAEEIWLNERTMGLSEWSSIRSLWADSGVHECYQRSNEYQLIDSAKYFLDSIDRISAPDYQPNYDDILRVRASTVGIVEITFPLRDAMLTVIDVGGQRSQRKKWIHCFEGIHSLIYVAALSEYNQVLYEDETKNRMQEALQLFETITGCRWFKKTPIILFLNKKDLFKEKLPLFPLSITFPDYTGSQDYEDCTQFIEGQFAKYIESKLDSFYTHRTCATDTKNVEFVMDACFDIVFSSTVQQVFLV